MGVLKKFMTSLEGGEEEKGVCCRQGGGVTSHGAKDIIIIVTIITHRHTTTPPREPDWLGFSLAKYRYHGLGLGTCDATTGGSG